MKSTYLLSLLGIAPLQAVIIYSDNFDDNTNTGWTYLNRNGADEIADAAWLETNGRLEQQTTNYDFPRDADGNDPVLGAIALAPVSVGGHYSVSAVFTSLEPGNGFQDQDLVFGYRDADNFFIAETIPSGLNLFQVVAGDRSLVGGGGISFDHDPTTLVIEHNADLGEVTLTYGGDAPATYSDPGLIMTGTASVGAGSNNDAFAIDDFTITQIPEPGSVTLLALSALTLCRRNRKNS